MPNKLPNGHNIGSGAKQKRRKENKEKSNKQKSESTTIVFVNHGFIIWKEERKMSCL